MIRLFGYLKVYLKYGIINDTNDREIGPANEILVNREEQYPGAQEEIPSVDIMPILKGIGSHSQSMWMLTMRMIKQLGD